MFANLNAFIAQQSAADEEHTIELYIIQNHIKLLKIHEERISQLEISYAQLIQENNDNCREIKKLKAGYRTSSDTISPSITDNITMSGVPFTIRDSPEIITEIVFEALGVAELIDDILEIRSANKKIDSHARANTGDVSLPYESSNSYQWIFHHSTEMSQCWRTRTE